MSKKRFTLDWWETVADGVQRRHGCNGGVINGGVLQKTMIGAGALGSTVVALPFGIQITYYK